jgi:hypothetical protein
LDLGWIDSAPKCLCNLTIGDLGPITAKNHVDDATFPSARFTKENDIWDGSLRYSMSLDIHDLEKTDSTLLSITAVIISSASELEKTFVRRS